MQENKLETITNLFEGKEIRSIWDDEKEEYYFSVVDVISVLTESKIPRRYWTDLKNKLVEEGSQLYENIVQLKMKSKKDGKNYLTDVLDTEGILRLIESVPSPNAEPFKLWLAHLGKERIDEVFDPELAINRAVSYYQKKGYSDEWIKSRVNGILSRKKLTDAWKENGINESYEYAMLTNEIYQNWSGMTANEYKKLKGIRKESLRDNMSDIELVLADLGELTTRDIVQTEKPYGIDENLKVAKRGGKVSLVAKELYEKETNRNVVTSKNNKGIINVLENKD
ncbi:MAG: phage antirepressor protein [Bacilli bacterium]|nr:phage antirepressor protein [Bacilli bacterium]